MSGKRTGEIAGKKRVAPRALMGVQAAPMARPGLGVGDAIPSMPKRLSEDRTVHREPGTGFAPVSTAPTVNTFTKREPPLGCTLARAAPLEGGNNPRQIKWILCPEVDGLLTSFPSREKSCWFGKKCRLWHSPPLCCDFQLSRCHRQGM